MIKKIRLKYKKDKVAFLVYSAAWLLIACLLSFSVLYLIGGKNKTKTQTQYTTLKIPDPIEKNQKSKRELQEIRIITNREFGSTLNSHDFINNENQKEEGVKNGGGYTNETLNGSIGSNNNIGSDNGDSVYNAQEKDIIKQANAALADRDSKMQNQQLKEEEKTEIQKLQEKVSELTTSNEIYKQREQTDENIRKGIVGIRSPSAISLDSSKTDIKDPKSIQKGVKSGGSYVGSSNASLGEAYRSTSNNGIEYTQQGDNSNSSHIGGLKTSMPINPHTLGLIKLLQETSPETKVLAAGKGYSILPKSVSTKSASHTVTAVIDHDHVLYNGSLVKIRLLAPVNIGVITIPLNYYVYGYASFQDERLSVQFKTIEFNGGIYPFKAKVYDFDGLEGLDAPGTKDANIAKSSSAEALKSTEIENTTYNKGVLESAAASITTGAINTVKQIGTLKILQQKVKIKAGHKLLLVIQKNQK